MAPEYDDINRMMDDTPFSLSDNNTAMIDERNGTDNILGDSDDVQTAGRILVTHVRGKKDIKRLKAG